MRSSLTPPAASRFPSGLNATQIDSDVVGSSRSTRPASASHSRMTFSEVATATVRPSGLIPTALTVPCSRSVFRLTPVSTSQMSTTSCTAAAIQRLSGLSAKSMMRANSESERNSWSVSRSQMRSVWSSPEVTRNRPSEDLAACMTCPPCPADTTISGRWNGAASTAVAWHAIAAAHTRTRVRYRRMRLMGVGNYTVGTVL